MHKIKQVFAGSIISVIILAAACSKITDDTNSLFGNYDQAPMLKNIGDSLLFSGINNLSTSATVAASAINAFSANPTDNTLTSAQSAWQALAQQWASVAPFDIGPMNDNLVSANIDTWPANASKIETAVSAQSNAGNVGADTKGLKGLEYLLFDKNGNAAVLAKYTAGDAANRKAFLNSVAQNLSTETSTLLTAWSNGYLNSFLTSKGNDVSSSVSQLINAMALYLDGIKNTKIGNPIGMGVKVNDNQSHADKIEYTIAEESLPAMKANVQAMKAVFDGNGGQGLDDLLRYVKAKKNGLDLSVVIDNQFDDVISKIDALNSPYATAVVSQKQPVQDVFNSLKILIAYLKVDVANNLGVTITFTDTDGD